MGPTWGPSGIDRTQVGPHVGPMNFAIWVVVHRELIFWWHQLTCLLNFSLKLKNIFLSTSNAKKHDTVNFCPCYTLMLVLLAHISKLLCQMQTFEIIFCISLPLVWIWIRKYHASHTCRFSHLLVMTLLKMFLSCAGTNIKSEFI